MYRLHKAWTSTWFKRSTVACPRGGVEARHQALGGGPAGHAHESEQQAWKQQVLNREIELEEIDTAPYRDRYGPNSVQVTRAQAAE